MSPHWLTPASQPSLRQGLRRELEGIRLKYAMTIFGLASSPHDGGRYVLACCSFGTICVWDTMPDNTERCSLTRVGKKRKMKERHSNLDPVIRMNVCKGILYDLQFIQMDSTKPVVVVCGEEGAFLFSWSDILSEIEKAPLWSARQKTLRLEPVAKFEPYPSPHGRTEINCVSFDEMSCRLYGAAGDSFGAYIWDVDTNKLLGTLGGPFCKNGHNDYLHAVKAVPSNLSGSRNCVLTGGEDGKLGIWDGKEQQIVEMIDCKAAMEDNFKQARSDNSGAGDKWGSNTSLWVSGIDVQEGGNWMAVGGGAEQHLNGAKVPSSFRATKAGANENGFVSIWNLPTRTLSSAYATRESIHQISYYPNEGKIVTVGNEGVVSYWNQSNVSDGRDARAWLSFPSAYSVSINTRLMAVGGLGRSVDCFSDLGNKSFSLIYR